MKDNSIIIVLKGGMKKQENIKKMGSLKHLFRTSFYK